MPKWTECKCQELRMTNGRHSFRCPHFQNRETKLRAQNAKLVEALRELLERVAPEGRYRSEEIEPYFKEPVAKARALLQSIEKGGAR